MNPEKILIIGLGSIGKRHLSIARGKYPDAQIKVLRSKKVSTEYAENNFLYSLEDAINFDPQIVVVANPASLHLSSATPFIKENRYFFIEKPISNDLNEAEIFLEMCKEKNAMVQIGYNLRFLTSLKIFKSYLDEGIVGDIWSVRSEIGQYLPSWRPQSDYKETVSAQKSLGGGVVNELSHEIDYLLWIFGNIKWVRALTSRQSNLDIDVEDTAHILMGFEHINRNITASLNMDFIRHDNKRECIVIGSFGSLKWDGIQGTVEFWKKDQGSWDELFKLKDLNESYKYECDDLGRSFLNNEEPLINGFDGLKTLSVLEEIKKSSQSEGIIMKIINQD
jgi:predicted dehydrogenase